MAATATRRSTATTTGKGKLRSGAEGSGHPGGAATATLEPPTPAAAQQAKEAAERNAAGGNKPGKPAGNQSNGNQGNSSVLRGRLIEGGSLPGVSGRGRKPVPVPEDLAADLQATLEGKGIMEFTGSPKEILRHKNLVKKWENSKNDSGDVPEGKEVRVEYRTVSGHMPSGKDDPGSESVTINYAAQYRLKTPAAAA